jgi:flagellar motor switch/type III secretory pathway protein FliN
MTSITSTLDAEVVVAAVISRTQLPGASIAELTPGDILETEPEVGIDPIVRLTVGTTIVAFASIAKVDGRLIATILESRPELSGRKGDKWKVRKPKPPKD